MSTLRPVGTKRTLLPSSSRARTTTGQLVASVCVRAKAFQSRWHHFGCRGVLFDADQRVHDAPFVGSFEDLWFVECLGRAFSCALESSDGTVVPVT